MRQTIIFIAFLFTTSISICQQMNGYDFDEKKYGFNSSDDLVKSFIRNLNQSEDLSDSILKHFVNKQASFYLVDKVAVVNREEAFNEVETGIDKRKKRYLELTSNLIWKIKQEQLDLNKLVVKDIKRSDNEYSNTDSVIFSKINTILRQNEQTFNLGLGTAVRLKNKWFFLEPSFSWENRSIALEKDIEPTIKKSLK